MLAYVFWHWPAPGTDVASYIAALAEFHRSLAASPPPGFHCSIVFLVAAYRWLPADAAVFEDWYLLENSGALDILNEAAVSGARKEPHDRAARAAAGGTAGLCRLRLGEAAVAAANYACRFSKPSGMSYQELYDMLGPLASVPATGLWQRQMTLGPGPEFCLLSPERVELPSPLEGDIITLNWVWPAE